MQKWWFRNAPQVRFVGLRFSITGGLRVSASYVSKVLARRRLTGQKTARPQRCHVAPKLSDLHPAILAKVTGRPDATIAELRAWPLETHKVSASTGLMNKTLAALDLTLKKVTPRRRASA
jgi:hypothetical protein